MLMSRASIAEAMELSPSTVEKLTARHDWPEPIRIGRSVRWRRDDVEAWLDRQTGKVTPTGGRRKTAAELLG